MSSASNSGPTTAPIVSIDRVAGGQPLEPAGDHGAHARRDGDDARRSAGQLIQATLRREEPEGLVSEERVALRPARDRRDEVLVGRRAGGRPDERSQCLTAQPAQADRPRDRLADQVGHRDRQRMIGRQLDVAIRTDDEDAHVPELAGQEAQEPE